MFFAIDLTLGHEMQWDDQQVAPALLDRVIAEKVAQGASHIEIATFLAREFEFTVQDVLLALSGYEKRRGPILRKARAFQSLIAAAVLGCVERTQQISALPLL